MGVRQSGWWPHTQKGAPLMPEGPEWGQGLFPRSSRNRGASKPQGTVESLCVGGGVAKNTYSGSSPYWTIEMEAETIFLTTITLHVQPSPSHRISDDYDCRPQGTMSGDTPRDNFLLLLSASPQGEGDTYCWCVPTSHPD